MLECVTADDFGMRPDWDAAILEALRRGVVTSVSVVPNGATFEPAMRALRRRFPKTRVAAHLNLVHGSPLTGPATAFAGSIGPVLVRYAAGRVSRAAVEREWAAQIQRVVTSWGRVDALNGHYHLHLLPGLTGAVTRLAQRFSHPRVRVLDGTLGWGPRVVALRAASARAERHWTAAGLEVLSGRGARDSARLGLDKWRAALTGLDRGRVEIICHPGQGAEESAALRSAELLAMLERAA